MINILHIVIPSNIGYFISWVHDFTVYIYIHQQYWVYHVFFRSKHTQLYTANRWNQRGLPLGIAVGFRPRWRLSRSASCTGERADGAGVDVSWMGIHQQKMEKIMERGGNHEIFHLNMI